MEVYILIISFFFVALVYSSVGFGGGSMYLALLAQPFFGLASDTTIKPVGLLCNIVVVTGGTIIFHRAGKIKLKEIWPFIAASIPLAFVGGYWKLKEDIFFILLGFTLLIASFFLWIKPKTDKPESNVVSGKILLGGGIGFLSGLVGIGGGIFLSPILHLLNWFDAKKISALASIFILVNSISGLLGQFTAGVNFNWQLITPLLIAVLLGGQIGSRLGAKHFNTVYIRRITALVIFVAALNILKDHL